MRHFNGILCLLFLVTIAASAGAQPYTLDKELKPIALALQDHPDADGVQWAGGEGTLESDPHYYYVKGLSALQRAEVTLIALNEDDELTLSMAKDNWEDEIDSCATGESGGCFLRFSTWGDAGFKITGNPEGAYHLVVLTGPQQATSDALPSPLYAANISDFDDEGNAISSSAGAEDDDGGIPFVLWVIVALLFVIIIILGRKLASKNTTATSLFIGLVIIAAMAPVDAAPPLGGTGWMGPAQWEQARAAQINRGIARVNEEYQRMDARLDMLRDAAGLIEDYIMLSECSAVSNPPGMPRIPSFCEGDEACRGCYADARGEFDRVRGVLVELQVIYRCTKNFTDKSIAFGDSASGVHGVSGLAWQSERAKIEQSVRGLQSAYDNKYSELMSSLLLSMNQINQCEAQYGVPDWYDRFGVMYYEFVKDKYRRSD